MSGKNDVIDLTLSDDESDSGDNREKSTQRVQTSTATARQIAENTDQKLPSVQYSSEDNVAVQKKNSAVAKKRQRPKSQPQELTIPRPGFNIPEWDEIKHTCWVCGVPLKLPNDEFCLYSTHAHPFLDAPCCCLCAEMIASLEVQQDEDACMGCGAESEVEVVLCDACDMQFCLQCLSKAHGGGTTGWEHTQRIVQSDDSWKCPCCEPPESLVALVESIKNEQTQREQNRTEAMVLEELQQLEHNLASTDSTLEKRDEVRAEIMQEYGEKGLSPAELEECIEEELESWELQQRKHYDRLLDAVAHLQEELETMFDFDLSQVYQHGIEHPTSKNDEENAEWKIAADREIQAREIERAAVPTEDDPEDYETDYENGAEDLVDSEDESALPLNPPLAAKRLTGFETKSRIRYSAQRIAELKRKEEENIPQLREQLKKTTELVDLAETKLEEGISKSRVHSDLKLLVQSRRQRRTATREVAKRKSVPQKQDSKPTNTSLPTADVTAKNLRLGKTTHAQDAPKVGTAAHQKKRVTPVSAREVARAAPQLPSTTTKPIFKLGFLPDELKVVLKDHQIEGIQTMWKNCFEMDEPGGMILAHNMGLGKTLTTLSFLWACMNNSFVESVLIAIPTNTISSWKNEFYRWISPLHSNCICLEDLDEVKYSKQEKVKSFASSKGPRALLVSHNLLKTIVNQALDVDMVVIDEAHVPLKNPKTRMFQALSTLKTPLRIALTGTPISNNLREYHAIMSFIRPGTLGSLAEFEREYIDPICRGLANDCSDGSKRLSEKKTCALFTMLKPHVNRKDASHLLKDLPPLQQVVLHIGPSKMQAKIFRNYKIMSEEYSEQFGNFFWKSKALSPINNHPAAILQDIEESPKEDEQTIKVKGWWKMVREKFTAEELMDLNAGYKVVLLLHVILMAERLNEKVLIFSGCLKTLSFIETVLQSNDWQKRVQGLPIKKEETVGSWKSGEKYLRIDGSMNANERSLSIKAFESSDTLRVFLLSVKATGLGITLTSASRVVIMDTDFNPTVTLQALFRCYRYGQEKPVFVYRLLMRGTIEEKVYARCVMKTGLSCRVIDSKAWKTQITQGEQEDLNKFLNWVQCDRCNKWRVLLHNDEIGDEFYCALNSDPKNNTCSAEERSQLWYEDELKGKHDGEAASEIVVDSVLEEESDALVQKDEILQHLLGTLNANGTKIITKHKFHQSLVAAKDLVHSVSTTSTAKAKDDSKVASTPRAPQPKMPAKQKTLKAAPVRRVSELWEESTSACPEQPRSNASTESSVHSKSDMPHIKSKPETPNKAKQARGSARSENDGSNEEAEVTTLSGRKVQNTKFYSKIFSTPERSRKRTAASQSATKGTGSSPKKAKHPQKPKTPLSTDSKRSTGKSTSHESLRNRPSNQRTITRSSGKTTKVGPEADGDAANDASFEECDESDDDTVDPTESSTKRTEDKKLADGAVII